MYEGAEVRKHGVFRTPPLHSPYLVAELGVSVDGRIRPIRRRGGLPERGLLRVTALHKEGAYWALRLSGAVNAVLEYDGRKVGREVVRLGEKVVAQASTFNGYNRCFELEAATARGPLPLVLEVRVSLWAAIESVTLRLAGRTIYYEHTYRAVEPARPPLPVPVDAATLAYQNLPRPLPAAPLEAAHLPRALAETPGALPAPASPALARSRRHTRTITALLALAGGFLG